MGGTIEDMVEYEGDRPPDPGLPLEKSQWGSTRTKLDDVRYDLIAPHALRRLAATYAEGARIHGEKNWLNGMSFSTILNHLMNHIVEWVLGNDDGEDHLAHAAWGLFALMEFEDLGRADLDDIGL